MRCSVYKPNGPGRWIPGVTLGARPVPVVVIIKIKRGTWLYSWSPLISIDQCHQFRQGRKAPVIVAKDIQILASIRGLFPVVTSPTWCGLSPHELCFIIRHRPVTVVGEARSVHGSEIKIQLLAPQTAFLVRACLYLP